MSIQRIAELLEELQTLQKKSGSVQVVTSPEVKLQFDVMHSRIEGLACEVEEMVEYNRQVMFHVDKDLKENKKVRREIRTALTKLKKQTETKNKTLWERILNR